MKLLSRLELEAMSTKDLTDFAESSGFDIPTDLDRRIIIGEILEEEEEYKRAILASTPAPEGTADEMTIVNNGKTPPEEKESLPETYNNTSIDAVLVNPSCLFVIWDIKKSDIEQFSLDDTFEGTFIHIDFFENAESEESVSSLDIRIQPKPGEQYILIPGGNKAASVSLTATYDKKPVYTLCRSGIIPIPSKPRRIRNTVPGAPVSAPPLVALSGLDKALCDSFVNYRQSFD